VQGLELSLASWTLEIEASRTVSRMIVCGTVKKALPCSPISMNTQVITEVARGTFDGSMPFPEVVSRLLATGVEYYHVDYAAMRKTFYSADGATVVTPIPYEGMPKVAQDFDLAALRASIADSQQKNQPYRDFTRRAMAAGVQGYFAFLRGKRVTYFGRQGDHHVEWFPGAGPTKNP
jgi:uncharacterized protein YbcV (DUF1398 family)